MVLYFYSPMIFEKNDFATLGTYYGSALTMCYPDYSL